MAMRRILIRRLGPSLDPAVQLSHASAPSLSLPRRCRLPDGTPLLVGFMTAQQISECYRMIEEDMRSGVGYLPREFSSQRDWQASLEDGRFFAISSSEEAAAMAAGSEEKTMVAGMVICRCSWVRLPKCAEGFAVVRPEWRQRGLGQLLGRLWEEFSRALGYRSLLADPYSNNKPVVRLALEQGFRHVGTIPSHHVTSEGEPITVLLLHKDLSGRQVASRFAGESKL